GKFLVIDQFLQFLVWRTGKIDRKYIDGVLDTMEAALKGLGVPGPYIRHKDKPTRYGKWSGVTFDGEKLFANIYHRYPEYLNYGIHHNEWKRINKLYPQKSTELMRQFIDHSWADFDSGPYFWLDLHDADFIYLPSQDRLALLKDFGEKY